MSKLKEKINTGWQVSLTHAMQWRKGLRQKRNHSRKIFIAVQK
jgi:hypothetical protein